MVTALFTYMIYGDTFQKLPQRIICIVLYRKNIDKTNKRMAGIVRVPKSASKILLQQVFQQTQHGLGVSSFLPHQS